MEIGPLSLRVLRELCTDSRISLSEMERRLSSPHYVLARHIKRLEETLGLRYTLEMDYTKLGLSKINVLHFKFSKKPTNDFIKSVVEKSDMVQFAMTMKGKDMGLVAFVTPRNTAEFAKWELTFILKFLKYGVAPEGTYIDIMHLGFMPLNEWAINSSDIKDVYKKLLVALNQNSRQTIRELSGKIGLNEDLTRYYLIKLEKEGIIKKFTTIITKPQENVNILLFTTYIFREGYVGRILYKRKHVFFKEENPLPDCNEYQMVASLNGIVEDFVWGIYKTEKEAQEKCVQVNKAIYEKDSPSMRYGYVDKVVKGFMPIRSINIKDNYVAPNWTEE